MSPVVLLLVGVLALGAGVLIGWLLASSRTTAAATALRVQAAQAQAELDAARQGAQTQLDAVTTSWTQRAAAERAAADARLTEVRDTLARQLADERGAADTRVAEVREALARQLTDERARAETRVAEVRETLTRQLTDERAQAAAELDRERHDAAQRLEELRADTQRLAEQFDSLSKKALEANSAVFLAQAEERLKRTQSEGVAELAKREQAVQQLVEPLSRALGEIKAEVTEAEKARHTAHTTLSEQLRAMREASDDLRAETGQLVTALRAPQVRGRWGELQLRRVVEAAGMVEHVDFEEQETHAGDDGVLRPDLVVKLPGGKQVVVDAKVAFSGYLEAMEAKDDATRASRLKAHARHLRTHIDDLSSKAYWDRVEGTPEFVVMFVPAEVFLNAALDQDPTLLEHAFAHHVVVATPATLVALLRTVGYTWRQEMLAAEAQQVLDVGRELHKRLCTMGRHLADLGRRLNATVESYNRLNSSLDRNVVTQVRRFSALQGLEPAIEAAPPLEILAVPAQKPDLYDADPEADVGAGPSSPAALPADRAALTLDAPGQDEADPALVELVESELSRAAQRQSPTRVAGSGSIGSSVAAP